MVTIVSRETIKPSSQSIHNLNPHTLCLFDQILPLTYATFVLFYPNIIGPEPSFNYTVSKSITQIKKSLSETLNLYFPFSGRITNDIYVDDFDAGVPFLEARVDCRMLKYFNSNDSELLNKFLPFPPFRKQTNEPTPIPLLAFQATIFSCRGLALGVSLCHKVADATSISNMLSSWAALCRGSHHHVVTPNFSGTALLFPPMNDFPENISALLDENELCIKEGNYVSRTFFFSAKAVETLRDKARTSKEDLPKPSHNEAVSRFIWKHVTELFQNDRSKPERVRLRNWKGLIFNDVDFGWGKPVKVGVMGKAEPDFSNVVVLVDAQWGNNKAGIQATVIMEEKLMAVLGRDVGFLAFASANVGVSSL